MLNISGLFGQVVVVWSYFTINVTTELQNDTKLISIILKTMNMHHAYPYCY